MTAIPATSVKVGTLVDGTLRVTCDVEPAHARAAFALFGSPGQPIALAALKPASSKPEKAEQEIAASHGQPGTLCLWAAMRCREPEFIAWVETAHPKLWEFFQQPAADETAALVVRHLCGVASRRELDTNEGAAALLKKSVMRPYKDWLERNPR